MKRIAPVATLLAFLFLLPSIVVAQPIRLSLTGTVVDDSTGTPLPGANVIIAGSMIGDATDKNGRFTLAEVPPGNQRLYVSMVGYEPQSRDIFVRQGQTLTFDFRLKPAVVQLGEVQVEAKDNKRWRQQLQKFIPMFVGETPNAEKTKIINPEVLDFKETLGHFTAEASQPLVIENRALGYRIQYFLKEFDATGSRVHWDGEPLYEELQPETPEQAAEWEASRRKAFYGSFRHFALALIAGKEEEHGFKVFSRPQMSADPVASVGPAKSAGALGNQRFPVKRSEYFSDGPLPDQKKIDFHGALEIIYTGEEEDQAYREWIRRYGGEIATNRARLQTSHIFLLKGPTYIDLKGDADPSGILFTDYWAFERVGDELPREYRPK